MEYCGAGSVLDIMKLRGMAMCQRGLAEKGEVQTLNEDEIATILCDTLKGLEYLHVRNTILIQCLVAKLLMPCCTKASSIFGSSLASQRSNLNNLNTK